MDDVPDLAALRRERMDSDAEYIEQLEGLLLGQEIENQRLRDRLRTVVERAHDHVGVDEHVLRSLATDDLVALVGVLRQDCRDAVYALTVERQNARVLEGYFDEVAESAVAAEAERDRMRAVVDAALEVVRPMADSACDADVLHIADLYRILAGPALDVRAEATDG